MKYYLVGIKGTGCASLACFLKDLKYEVIGSDVKEIFFTDKILKEKNITILDYNIENITNDYYYIIGNGAINSEEARKIIEGNYEYRFYSDFINDIQISNKIAISGTHGKTTTTKMLFDLLEEISPSIIRGDGDGYGNQLSETLIFEACEYKNHFLSYFPNISVINNIELDHPDFFKNENDLISSFQKFANNSRYLVINGDDKLCKKINHPNKISFGFNKNNDYRCKIIKKDSKGYLLLINNEYINLPLVGKHMIYNFLGCYAIIDSFYKEKITYINTKNIKLPKRRFEKFIYNNKIFIKDYAHHPTEIKAFYGSLKQMYPKHKYIVFFQPHTYSRTLKFKKQFKRVLSLFDEVYIEDVFTSREIMDNSLQNKINKIFKKFKKLTIEKYKELIRINETNNKIYIFLGAGNLTKYISLTK